MVFVMDGNEDWWGYSKENGIVYLDRTIPCNFPGSHSKYLFVSCSVGFAYQATKKDWNSYLPISINKNILSDFEKLKERLSLFKEIALKEWNNIQINRQYGFLDEFTPLEREEALKVRCKNNHIDRLNSLGVNYGGIRDAKSNYRKTHCYNCKQYLDGLRYFECLNCGWIICNCGACGCGYK
jgi:hypothetical protein